MPELILHHYEISPFSAKIRAMLGYCDLPWQSARTAPLPPRPGVDTLTGGYRRIPAAQLGADVFCDSRLIGEEVAAMAGRPELSLAQADDAQRELATRAELEVFFACVSKAAGWPLLRRVIADYGPVTLFRTLRDRAGMTRSMNEPRLQKRGPGGDVNGYLDDLEALLVADFLFGDQPTIADFAAWHCLWFATEVGGRNLAARLPRVQAWMQTVAAFETVPTEELSADQVLAIAGSCEPRELPADIGEDDLLGKPVTIGPADYATDTVTGILVASQPDRFILRRDTLTTGTVHVHFPRERFAVTSAAGR
ncbi:glutathione S-transferase family protein [Parahaliea maris]|uniref:Glutathione S-transferase family protein n=1 Tax=Parahaliea maris TaxID=2716870 RepID=A0A5C8ZT49_9GAMM|nr:glutathione S-transferase family protein [Parahaliea maris]TXS90752.1 glutathione S-transferase family protein [Parahaliea maris]